MNNIQTAFQNKNALITYLVAGDPNLVATAEYILAAQDAGSDLIGISIPFSDPVAESEEMQAASLRAVAAGTNLTGVFDMLASIKDKVRIPMVFITYLNPVFVYGYESFFARCADIGISGIVIPDLPFEEQHEVTNVAASFGIALIALVAPTSANRTAMLVRQAKGFISLIPSANAADTSAMVSAIRNETDTPIVADFGITTPDQAQPLAALVDGIVVSDAIARIIHQNGKDTKQAIYAFLKATRDHMCAIN